MLLAKLSSGWSHVTGGRHLIGFAATTTKSTARSCQPGDQASSRLPQRPVQRLGTSAGFPTGRDRVAWFARTGLGRSSQVTSALKHGARMARKYRQRLANRTIDGHGPRVR